MAYQWNKQKRETIMARATDDAFVQALTDQEREDLQLDLCRRFGWTFTRPDGTIPLVPVTGPGDEV